MMVCEQIQGDPIQEGIEHYVPKDLPSRNVVKLFLHPAFSETAFHRVARFMGYSKIRKTNNSDYKILNRFYKHYSHITAGGEVNEAQVQADFERLKSTLNVN